MKRKSWIVVLCMIVLAAGAVPSYAATAMERIEAAEQAAGVASGNTMAERLAYLEEQFGITPADGSTIDERIMQLEQTLGIAEQDGEESAQNNNPEPDKTYDNASYQNEVSLEELGPYTIDRMRSVPELYLEDNYHNTYAYGISSIDSDIGVVEYQLNGEYSELAGTFYVPSYILQNGQDHRWETAAFYIYADDQLIYKISGFSAKSEPISILLDVRGVQFLKIKTISNYCFNIGMDSLIVFGDPVLDPADGGGENRSYDNGVYKNETLLAELEYFQKDRMMTGAVDIYGEDNFGGKYAYALTSIDSDPASIEYLLNGEYTEFEGTVYVSSRALQEGHDFQWDQAKVSVYADDQLIYTSPGFDEKKAPEYFCLDVTDVKFLKICFDNNYYYDFSTAPLLILGDPTLLN